MVLTQTQEEALVEKYDRLVWSIVHRFKRRNNTNRNNLEDLYQESMLVLIDSLRNCTSLEEYRPPIRDMINAMCRYTLGEQVVVVPRRTSDYRKRMDTIPKAVDFSVLDYEEDMRVEFTVDSDAKVAFNSFLSSLPDVDQQIINLKLDGKKNCVIAKMFGMSNAGVTRRLHAIREQYAVYAA